MSWPETRRARTPQERREKREERREKKEERREKREERGERREERREKREERREKIGPSDMIERQGRERRARLEFSMRNDEKLVCVYIYVCMYRIRTRNDSKLVCI